jgi:hypothetical protein
MLWGAQVIQDRIYEAFLARFALGRLLGLDDLVNRNILAPSGLLKA